MIDHFSDKKDPAVLILNTLFPLFVLLCMGNGLVRTGMTSKAFLGTADRLVYYIFFPVMLFWKVGAASGGNDSTLKLTAAGFLAVGAVALISLLFIRRAKIPAFQAGSFSQSCFRFNTYIGMAIVLGALGEEGVRYFGILVGMLIPAINAMAVSVLIWYASEKMPLEKKIGLFTRALLSNPLILGCAAGFLVSKAGIVFPPFIHNTFALISSVTLPLALISIGGSLSFNGVARYCQTALAASFAKLFILPVLGWLCLTIFGVEGIPFRVGMIFFCLPTGTSIYVLSAQLNSDVELASVTIMVSTLLSFLSLSLALLI